MLFVGCTAARVGEGKRAAGFSLHAGAAASDLGAMVPCILLLPPGQDRGCKKSMSPTQHPGGWSSEGKRKSDVS